MSEQEDKPIAERLNDLPQWVLRVVWRILWSLNKLIQFKPAWYVCRAILWPIVGLFGWRVDGISGKELWIDVSTKKERRKLEELSLLICQCGHSRVFHAEEQPHECWYFPMRVSSVYTALTYQFPKQIHSSLSPGRPQP